MDKLGEELRNFAMAVDVSNEFLPNVIVRVQDKAQQGSKRALNKGIQVCPKHSAK
jgi:hypothetical protein